MDDFKYRIIHKALSDNGYRRIGVIPRTPKVRYQAGIIHAGKEFKIEIQVDFETVW